MISHLRKILEPFTRIINHHPVKLVQSISLIGIANIIKHESTNMKFSHIKILALLMLLPLQSFSLVEINGFNQLGQIDGLLFVVPDIGLASVIETYTIMVDVDDDAPEILLFEKPNDIIDVNGHVFAKYGADICQCYPDSIERVFTFETENFRIMPMVDHDFAVVFENDTLTYVLACDAKTHEVSPLFSSEDHVVYCYGATNDLIVVTDQDVFLMTEEESKPLLSYYMPIKAAVQTNFGLVLATESDVFFLTSPNEIGVLVNAGCDKLYSSGDVLYLTKGNLVNRIDLKAYLDN